VILIRGGSLGAATSPMLYGCFGIYQFLSIMKARFVCDLHYEAIADMVW
jgi:hypothetical protein